MCPRKLTMDRARRYPQGAGQGRSRLEPASKPSGDSIQDAEGGETLRTATA